MSKAFIIESDESADEPAPQPCSANLPPGAKNYMTPDGAQRMRRELEWLVGSERPQAAREGSANAEAKRRLQRIDQRVAYLSACLRSAEVVNLAAQAAETVCFGATVVVRDDAGVESSYRIVGVDEIDLNEGWVSWLSPAAKSLLGAKVGETVKFRTPTGEVQLLVVRITCS